MSCEDRKRSRFSYSDNTTLLQTMRIHRISVTFRPSRGATMSMELAPAALQPYLLPRLVLLLKMVHILNNSNDILLLPLTQSKVTAINVLWWVTFNFTDISIRGDVKKVVVLGVVHHKPGSVFFLSKNNHFLFLLPFDLEEKV